MSKTQSTTFLISTQRVLAFRCEEPVFLRRDTRPEFPRGCIEFVSNDSWQPIWLDSIDRTILNNRSNVRCSTCSSEDFLFQWQSLLSTFYSRNWYLALPISRVKRGLPKYNASGFVFFMLSSSMQNFFIPVEVFFEKKIDNFWWFKL